MATTKCGFCGSASGFELVQGKVDKAAYKLNFVQCKSCGSLVTVVEFYDAGVEAKAAHEGVKAIGNAMGLRIE